jgi:hypothetical protein
MALVRESLFRDDAITGETPQRFSGAHTASLTGRTK